MLTSSDSMFVFPDFVENSHRDASKPNLSQIGLNELPRPDNIFAYKNREDVLRDFFLSQYETKHLSILSSISVCDADCGVCSKSIMTGEHFVDIEFYGTNRLVSVCEECFVLLGYTTQQNKCFLYRRVLDEPHKNSARWCLMAGFKHIKF